MTIALTLLGAMLFPVASLVLLLWLTRLEETLPRDVEAARRKPAPAPILAIPVRGSEAAGTGRARRVAPRSRRSSSCPGSARRRRSRSSPAQRETSAVLSLGGSTNR